MKKLLLYIAATILFSIMLSLTSCSGGKSIKGSKWYKGYKFRDEHGTLVPVNPQRKSNWKSRYSLFK